MRRAALTFDADAESLAGGRFTAIRDADGNVGAWRRMTGRPVKRATPKPAANMRAARKSLRDAVTATLKNELAPQITSQVKSARIARFVRELTKRATRLDCAGP
jgi:hypothetical protein